MSQSLYPYRSTQIASRKLGGEMMIMSASDSTLFTLNETATILWEAADGSASLEEIVAAKIFPQFDVEYEKALDDTETLAQQLASHGILFLASEPKGPGRACSGERVNQ